MSSANVYFKNLEMYEYNSKILNLPHRMIFYIILQCRNILFSEKTQITITVAGRKVSSKIGSL
jgi:hypothetical protein